MFWKIKEIIWKNSTFDFLKYEYETKPENNDLIYVHILHFIWKLFTKVYFSIKWWKSLFLSRPITYLHISRFLWFLNAVQISEECPKTTSQALRGEDMIVIFGFNEFSSISNCALSLDTLYKDRTFTCQLEILFGCTGKIILPKIVNE